MAPVVSGLFTWVIFLVIPAWAAPPPSLVAGIPDFSELANSYYNRRDMTKYLSLFSDDIHFEDNIGGHGAGKVAFMAYVRRSWNDNLHYERMAVSRSSTESLEFDNFTNNSGYHPGVVRDCCNWAVATKIGWGKDRLINSISFLSAPTAAFSKVFAPRPHSSMWSVNPSPPD